MQGGRRAQPIKGSEYTLAHFILHKPQTLVDCFGSRKKKSQNRKNIETNEFTHGRGFDQGGVPLLQTSMFRLSTLLPLMQHPPPRPKGPLLMRFTHKIRPRIAVQAQMPPPSFGFYPNGSSIRSAALACIQSSNGTTS